MSRTLPDAPARDLILSALGENLLVEAGAGSGKTTSLVGRMVALVRDGGVEVERIAAVTFTRKAAGELRERFQEAVERARRDSEAGSQQARRLDRTLRSMDRAFMGTIHAFCARLLRERPLEAGLDPAFQELTAPDATLLSKRWWNVWLERLATDGDPALDELAQVGIPPHRLQHAFETLGEYTDVDFPAPEVPRPDPADVAAVRAELEALMDEADRILPDEEPDKGWDGLQAALRTAWFQRRTLDWADDRVFLDVLALVHAKAGSVVMNRWRTGGPLTPKELKERFREWAGAGSRATRLVRAWLAHRYPPALGFARRAAHEFARYRRRTGQLSFHDLLAITAGLLRRSPGARTDLGRRYTHVLVDEFQDTDPLQAEILFLLTSEPGAPRGSGEEVSGEREPPVPDWTHVRPRPGALFVVGDPKQSIYRFRRADIALYQQVRERFDDFGRVVRLTANFRSRPPLGELVDHVFGQEGIFPGEATRHQARFAPMEPVRSPTPRERTVRVHDVPPCTDSDVYWASRPGHERPVEARALAGWVRGRVASGERRPGDFLVLTRWKRGVDLYARALEARNLPVQVSGAGVGIDEELAELRRVLEALSDPDDPVLTVAALTGLLFGLDLEQLLRHRETAVAADERYPFDFRRVSPEAEGEDEPVVSALATLHRWWRMARREPADLVVQTLVDELGLLPWTAAGELGQVRAGALAFVLDVVRSAGLQGDTSLVGALDALEAALGDEEVEAPLEPGRQEAVRVMNLHKAKGLEAPVVILADPHPMTDRPTRLVVERDTGGRPAGWMRIGEPGAWGSFDDLARPLEWDEKHEAERRFEEAEEARLLYVAATRAGDELLLMRVGDRKRAPKSPWSPLHGWIDEHGGLLELAAEKPGPRDRLEAPPDEMVRRTAEARGRRRASGHPAYSFDTVTARVRATRDGAPPRPEEGPEERRPPTEPPPPDVVLKRPGWELSEADATGPGGYEWGNAVHAVLEAAARGLDDDALRAAARTALLENDRPVEDDEPVELDTLLDLVTRVRASELWRRSREAEVRLAEQPFVLEGEDGRYLEGVVDLLFREEDGWVVVDYKTDRGDAPDFEERMERYRAQVAAYARSWSRLTGEPVKESIVWTVRGATAAHPGDSEEPGPG